MKPPHLTSPPILFKAEENAEILNLQIQIFFLSWSTVAEVEISYRLT